MRVHTAIVGALCALGMLAAGTSTAWAAGSTSVVISQVYGGGNNIGATYQNDYVELFNRGAANASLSGWSVQYASATGTGNFVATALSGSIPAGGYYLVKLTGGTTNGAALPAAQATGTTNMSATAGKVIVASTASGIACNGGSTTCSETQLAQIVDLVGFGTGAGGTNFFEGAAAAPTMSNTLADFRKDGGCTDTDQNGADFDPAALPLPRNASTTAHPCGGSTNPSGAGSASPSSVAAGADSLLTVAVTPGTSPASSGIAVSADLTSIGGASAQQLYDDGTHGDVTAGDSTFSYRATVAAATTTGAKSLPVTIGDAQSRSAATTIALTIAEDCGSPRTRIHDIQGSGATSPMTGSTVSIEGVVVGDYQAAGAFDGFYVQERDASADADPATSEGIFVFAPSATAVGAGDIVRVRGNVAEFASGSSHLTELSGVSSVVVCDHGASVAPTDVTLPVPALADFERYEGMLVHFTQPLTASDTFTLARFGEVRLAAGGRLYVPTAIVDPGAPAIAQEDLNQRRSFVLDDGDNRQDIDPTLYPLGGLSATNTLRSGDTVSDLTAVFDDRFSSYRAQPVGSVSFTQSNPRPAAPPDVGGNLRVASFNVLNFFNGNGTHLEGAAGGFPTSRGANTLTEFNRQIAKEVAALAAIDGDIVGLMEMENDAPPNSALEDLVSALNDRVGAGTYAFVDTGVIGTDEIKVALIYKPAKVTPVGAFKLLTSAVDPRFIDTKSRPSLAQTFELTATHRRITVDVNHLKSKGSDCVDVGDPDTGDGQGNCSHTREQAAEALVDWLAGDPTHSGNGDTLVIGDMNSYTFEDPIKVFTSAGFTNLVRAHGGLDAYSYVFDGESGYLDHALATPSLAAKVTGAADWHINSDEPIGLDYNTEFKSAGQIASFYADGPYRSSDHDPVVVGVSLPAKTTPTVTWANPSAITYGDALSATQLDATASVPGHFAYTPPAGTVLHAGAGQTLSVTFTPDDTANYEAVTQTVTIDVLRAPQHVSFTSTAPTAAVPGGPGYHVTAVADSGLPVTVSVDPAASSVCTLSGSTVTFTAPGTCTLDADQPGDADHLAAARLSQSFAVRRVATTLTAAPASKTLLGLLPVRFSARLVRTDSAAPIASQPVSFRVLGEQLCSATTNSAGTATCSARIGLVALVLARSYSATYAGSATYLPSSDTAPLN